VACDSSLDLLLELDGQVLVMDPEGGHWVSFTVTRVPTTLEKPHGLDYSLTLPGRTASGWWGSTMPSSWPTQARRTAGPPAPITR
jgi:hypothetical protein